MRDQISAKRTAVEELGAVMLEAASKVEARRMRLVGLEQEFRHAIEAARDLEARIDEESQLLARDCEERAELRSELEKLAAQHDEAIAREAEFAGAIGRLEGEASERARALDDCRGELKRAQNELEAVEQEAVECRLRGER